MAKSAFLISINNFVTIDTFNTGLHPMILLCLVIKSINWLHIF